jgi:hypothetical protein
VSVVVNGKAEEVPGVATVCYLEDPRLRIKLPEDGKKRVPGWSVRHIVLHTTKGVYPGLLRLGVGKNSGVGVRSANYCARNPDSPRRSPRGGHHLTMDWDGTVSCHMDLAAEEAFHAHSLNRYSIGIEIYQGGDGTIYEGQLQALVRLCDWLTRRFGIQRQMHRRWPRPGKTVRFTVDASAKFVGIVGHRDAVDSQGRRVRGRGDPPEQVFDVLEGSGYEVFDAELGADMATWKARQQQLGVGVDGVPGPQTVEALKRGGSRAGLWVVRPGD